MNAAIGFCTSFATAAPSVSCATAVILFGDAVLLTAVLLAAVFPDAAFLAAGFLSAAFLTPGFFASGFSDSSACVHV